MVTMDDFLMSDVRYCGCTVRMMLCIALTMRRRRSRCLSMPTRLILLRFLEEHIFVGFSSDFVGEWRTSTNTWRKVIERFFSRGKNIDTIITLIKTLVLL